MIELRVDGQLCDMGAIPVLPIGFDAERLTDVEGYRSGRTVEFELPFTSRNNALFGSSCDLYATSRFNMQHHPSELLDNGLTLLSGTLHLLATEVGVGYKVRLVEGGSAWIEQAVSSTLDELPIEFDERLTLQTIHRSWSGDAAVRFLPVSRGDDYMEGESQTVVPIERVLLLDDYHPFISVAEMVRMMFESYGYTLKSELMDTSLFKSLYMSGDYTHSDLASDSYKCDFLARRAAPVTATADFTGVVYASTAFATHTVGNIVDTADPTAIDYEGKLMSDTFTTNNCFAQTDGRITFTPVTAVNVGFELHVEYTTDYRIKTRERLKGFDIFDGLHDVHIEYALNNTFKDRRNELASSTSYRVVVFDHVEGCEYRLVEELASGEKHTMGSWSSRSALVESSSEEATAVTLRRRVGDTELWAVYEGDWALYDGHVEEEGELDVEITVRMPPVALNRGQQLLLDKFWFGGAEPGMRLTLGTGTSLRPYFTNVAGYGSNISYADIAPKQVRQIELLEALSQMFHLAFITDEERKEVRIDSLDDLYKCGEIVDWSSRIDFSQPITLSDTGIDRPQRVVLAYIDADKASHRYNLENETRFGAWSWSSSLYGTTDSTKRLTNNLFTTTLNIDNVVASAPSAELLQVGDVANDEVRCYGEFTPRIVSYQGVQPLPEGEYWSGAPSSEGYPYATFLNGERGINLCFEEREGVEGLASHYKEQLQREESRQLLSLTLRLRPEEIVHLAKYDGLHPSVLDRYRFSILGESAIFRLVRFEAWDPTKSVVKSIFQRELGD